MSGISPSLDQAVALLNAGRHSDAAMAGMAAIRENPRDDKAWQVTALALAVQGDAGLVLQLAGQRGALLGDEFAFFHDVLLLLESYGLRAPVEALARAVPSGSPLECAGLYATACRKLLDGDEDAAFADLARLKAALARWRDQLPIGPEDRFNIAYRQASLVEDGEYLTGLDPAALAETASRLPEFRIHGPWRRGEAPFAVLAACDGRYLERFGGAFLHSAATQGGGAALHLHVVEPEAEALAAAEAEAARLGLVLNLSSEGANPWRSGAYFACCRFLVAGRVVEAGGLPLVISDIDVTFARPLADLARAAQGHAMASFVHDGPGPCSRLPAGITWFAADADGRAALEVMRAFILSKISVPWPHNWMLDQAALMAVSRWLRRHRPGARVGDLNRLTGAGMLDTITCLGDEDEKARLIRAAARQG